jgi:S-adenosylmethionine hydrolase
VLLKLRQLEAEAPTQEQAQEQSQSTKQPYSDLQVSVTYEDKYGKVFSNVQKVDFDADGTTATAKGDPTVAFGAIAIGVKF